MLVCLLCWREFIFDLKNSLFSDVFPFQELDGDTLTKGINVKRCVLITRLRSRQGYEDEK